MPVPSAYNDITTDIELRDHVGWVWYQTEIVSHKTDANYRLYLRFSSVNYYAIVVGFFASLYFVSLYFVFFYCVSVSEWSATRRSHRRSPALRIRRHAEVQSGAEEPDYGSD